MLTVLTVLLMLQLCLSQSDIAELFDISNYQLHYEMIDIYKTDTLQVGHLYKIDPSNINIIFSNKHGKNIVSNITYFTLNDAKYIGTNNVQYRDSNRLLLEKNINIVNDTCIGKTYNGCSFSNGCIMRNNECIGIGVLYSKNENKTVTNNTIEIILLILVIGTVSFIIIASIISYIILHIIQTRKQKNMIHKKHHDIVII